MTIGIFLSFGESLKILNDTAQRDRFIYYYLEPYSKSFDYIYIFSWKNEKFVFPFNNVILVPNKWKISPYIYQFIIPFIHNSKLKQCNVLRLMQTTAMIPAIISKILHQHPIISTYGFPYGQFFNVKKKHLRAFIWKILEKFLLSHIDRFIVTYKSMLQHLVKNGVKKELITILPNGVDIDIFSPSPNNNNNNNNNNINLLYVGRFSIEKNLFAFVDAIKYSAHKKMIHLTMIGNGYLKEKIILRLKNNKIKFTIYDKITHNKLVDYYHGANLFILPSQSEGYPKVLIEAMACGIPCLVGRWKGYEQIVKEKENAISCNLDVTSITKALDMLIADKSLQKHLATGARTFAIKHNDIKKIINTEIEEIKYLIIQTS